MILLRDVYIFLCIMLLDIFATCLSKKEEGPSYESSIPAQKERCKKL